jgi:hypothetical protein
MLRVDKLSPKFALITKPWYALFLFRFSQTWQHSLMHKERF